jgi:hypothetical protein
MIDDSATPPGKGPAADDLARRRLVFVAITVGIATAAVVLFLFEPAASSFYPPCLFHYATGLHCPGCGTLRALHCLLHMDLLQAMGRNPLMMLCLPFVAYAYVSYGLLALRGRSLPGTPGRAWLAWAVFGVLTTYWAVRNLPYYPFNLLAP